MEREFIIELIVFIELDKNSTYAAEIDGFRYLFSVDKNLTLEKEKLLHSYTNNEDGKKVQITNEFNFKIQEDPISEQQRKVYHMTLTSVGNEPKDIEKVLRDLRRLLEQNQWCPEIIRDDVSLYFAKLAYPILHEIENLMRKLISSCLQRAKGKNWFKDTAPKKLEKALHEQNRGSSGEEFKFRNDRNSNELYQLNFNELANFLFEEYAEKEFQDLHDEVESAKDNTEVSLENLKLCIPKSNWNRYFKGVAKKDDKQLKDAWEKLNALRNMVAHNTKFTSINFERVVSIVKGITPDLEEAYRNISKFEPSEEQSARIVDAGAFYIQEFAEFVIFQWKELESSIRDILLRLRVDEAENNGDSIAFSLTSTASVHPDFYHTYCETKIFVNGISGLEGTGGSSYNSFALNKIKVLNSYLKELESYLERWSVDVVIEKKEEGMFRIMELTVVDEKRMLIGIPDKIELLAADSIEEIKVTVARRLGLYPGMVQVKLVNKTTS